MKNLENHCCLGGKVVSSIRAYSTPIKGERTRYEGAEYASPAGMPQPSQILLRISENNWSEIFETFLLPIHSKSK